MFFFLPEQTVFRFIVFLFASSPGGTNHRVRLQKHRKHYQTDAYPEGETHFLQLAEEHGSDGDAVERFQIVGHVHRKGIQLAQCL